ncbi:ATP-binding protein [Anaerolineales bacterium HSG25]|nr:ATP-binding protein [Anaerolineales bacterium HSG25]
MKQSLSIRINLIIVFAVMTIMVIFSAYELWQAQTRVENDLHQSLIIISERLANNTLVEPIWTFNEAALEKSIAAEMRDEHVQAVIIRDSFDNTLILGKQRGANWEIIEVDDDAQISSSLETALPIIRGNNKLGVVEVYLTDKFTKKQIQADFTTLFITVILLLVLIVSTLAIVIHRTISRPVNALIQVFETVAGGDLEQPIDTSRTDEIGSLAKSFAHMRDQIRAQINTLNDEIQERKRVEEELKLYRDHLEERDSDRTHQLKVVASLSEQLNAILDVEQLLAELMTQIEANFDYYHTHIYLLDSFSDYADKKETLVMAAGTGQAGIEMKQKGHAISLNTPTSLVAQAARRAEIVRVDNVREANDWLPNPLLPDTYSEMAIPIIAEEKVVGVLNVQDNEIGGLDDGDANLMRSLAGHIAVAMTNARLFAQNQAALQETETLYTISQRMITANDLSELIAAMVEEATIPAINRAVLALFDHDEAGVASMTVEANWYSGHGPEPTKIGVRYERQALQTLELMVSDKLLFFEDFPEDDRVNSTEAEIVRQLQIRALILLPVHSSQIQLGVLLLQGTDPYQFSQQEIRPYLSMLGQLATAIENRQLFAETIKAKEEAEEAEKKADLANKAKSEFLSSMSHELRTPLNGILGYAQILKRDEETLTTLQRDGLDVIQSSGNHLLTLITDILDLSKIEAGKMELQPDPIYLPSFLEGVAGMVRMRAEQKKLLFNYKPASDLPTGIEVDEKRLRQILLNLLGNAVKFTDKGQISFQILDLGIQSSEAETDTQPATIRKLRFEVTDTGVGITPEDLAKVFHPFEQVGDQQKQIQGTGLGLAISQQLVEAMGGELRVESIAGQGSTFWFELLVPTATGLTQLNQKKLTKKVTGYRGSRRKVLVVDDKEYNISVLLNMIEPLGFEISTARNGQEAIQQTQTMRPDIIFMDMIMPIMTGFEATQEIRKLPELQGIVIVGASASAFEEDKKRVALVGCDAFLAKPIDEQELLEVLQELLDLQWEYASDRKTDGRSVAQTDNADNLPTSMDLPPQAKLEEFLKLAKRRRLQKIQKLAVELEQSDNRYRPFATELQALANSFNTKAVVKFLEDLLEKTE